LVESSGSAGHFFEAMVAQKRAASKAGQAGSGKAARKEDAFTEDCTAVLSLLERDANLNEVTRGMLQTALPHALCTPGADRHDFQKKLVEELAAVFNGVQVNAQSSTDAANAKVEDAARVVGEATDAEKAALGQVEEKKTTRDGSDKAAQEASAEVTSATVSLEEVKTQEGNLQGDHDKAVAAHEEHAKFLADAWAPLKVGKWTGKNAWRERNKLIEKLQGVMEALQMEETLRKSLPYALKGKVEDRGSFANSSIEFTEKDLNDHLESLKKEIDGHDEKVVECRKAVEAAEQALKAAEEVQESRLNELKEAEDALGQAKESHKTSKDSVKAAKQTENSMNDALNAAKVELDSIKELLGKFEALCQNGKAPRQGQAPEEAAAAAE